MPLSTLHTEASRPARLNRSSTSLPLATATVGETMAWPVLQARSRAWTPGEVLLWIE